MPKGVNRNLKDLIMREEEKRQQKIFTGANKVFLRATIEDELEYSNKLYEKIFYKSRVASKRLNDQIDYVPIIISDNILNGVKENFKKGKMVEIIGSFRSFKHLHHLELFVFVTEIHFVNEGPEVNVVYLDGYIYNTPYKRVIKERKLSDFLVVVNREYYKTDYIPCIAWDWKAKVINKLMRGDKIQFYGRMQSRLYLKSGRPKEVYEIAVIKIEHIEKQKDN